MTGGRNGRGSRHVLVTGSHRSGTTWVGRTICQHPRMKYVGEPFNIGKNNVYTPRGLECHFTHYESFEAQHEIREAMDMLFHGGSFRYMERAIRRIGWHPRGQARFARGLLRGGLPRPDVLMKDPMALLSAGWLHETYGLKVVCLIRDPLAFIGSVKVAEWDFKYENFSEQKALMEGLFAPYREQILAMRDGEGDFIDRTTFLWNLLHIAILDYRNRYPDWLFVTYEDLAVAPREGFARIFDHIGLEMTPSIENYIDSYTSGANPVEAKSDQYQPRDARSGLETWRSRLTEEEIERVVAATTDIKAQFYGTAALAAEGR